MWKHLENSKFTYFDLSNVSLDWSKKLKNLYQTFCLARLVLNHCSIDQKRTFDRSTSNRESIELDKRFPISLDWSKLIFNWSKHVKHEFSIIFLKQFSTVFMNKLPSYKHNRLNLRPKTEFHWCYSLKVQSNILNIKLKQHHNINISFNQTIISITMQKINYIIF